MRNLARTPVVVAVALTAFSGCLTNMWHGADSDAPARDEAVNAVSALPEKSGRVGEPGGPPAAQVGFGAAPTPPRCTAVSTVLSPELPRREISLAECIALALENGRTGEFFDRAGSGRWTSVSDVARPSSPAAVTDSVRVFAYDPAILGTEIEQSLSKFDAIWQTGLIWNRFDEPPAINTGTVPGQLAGIGAVGAIPTTLGGLVSEFGTLGKLDLVQFQTELLKPLPTGGVAGITFRTDYENLQTSTPGVNIPFVPSIINPTYRPAVELNFEQPLLRGGGVAINELADTFPGSLLHPLFPVGGRAPGIILARTVFEEGKLEYERRIHALLFTVEEAYWELYGAYWDLYSRETGMRQAFAAWQVAKERYDRGGLGLEELAQIEEQFHLFRSQRLEALGRGTAGRTGVLEAERRLRYVIGLPPEDGTRLIPIDPPTDAPYDPDWESAVAEAVIRRPELLEINQEIRAAQLAVLRAKDLLKPDLRFISKVNTNGLGQDLSESFRSLADDHAHDWEMGLLFQVPIGFREGNAEVRRASLQVAQRLAYLRDQEEKVVLSLQRSQRDLIQFREEIRTRRSQRQAAAVQVQARYDRFLKGRETIDFLLSAQRHWADSLRDEYVAICNYNVALADYERQRGTILDHDHVVVAEGPLPACAQLRASEHIRQLNHSLVIKRADATPPLHLEAARSNLDGHPDLPGLVEGSPPPIPTLLAHPDSLPDDLDLGSAVQTEKGRAVLLPPE